MLGFILVLMLYFVPTFAASSSNRGSVFVLNFLFGWTLIGWGIALYLAVKSHEAAAAVR